MPADRECPRASRPQAREQQRPVGRRERRGPCSGWDQRSCYVSKSVRDKITNTAGSSINSGAQRMQETSGIVKDKRSNTQGKTVTAHRAAIALTMSPAPQEEVIPWIATTILTASTSSTGP